MRNFIIIVLWGIFFPTFCYGGQQAAICQAKNFTDFLNHFTESIEMQQQCTKFPLKKTELVELEDDLVPQTKKIALDQMTFPLIVSMQARQEQKLSLKINVNNNKKAQVVFYKPDTGYRISYRFIRKNTWQLIQMEDWAI